MSKSKSKEAPVFEDLLASAESHVERLEAGELSLDEALEAYGKGVEAIRECHALLKQAQGKVEKLTVRGGEAELTELDPDTVKEKGKPRRAKLEDEGELF